MENEGKKIARELFEQAIGIGGIEINKKIRNYVDDDGKIAGTYDEFTSNLYDYFGEIIDAKDRVKNVVVNDFLNELDKLMSQKLSHYGLCEECMTSDVFDDGTVSCFCGKLENRGQENDK